MREGVKGNRLTLSIYVRVPRHRRSPIHGGSIPHPQVKVGEGLVSGKSGPKPWNCARMKEWRQKR